MIFTSKKTPRPIMPECPQFDYSAMQPLPLHLIVNMIISGQSEHEKAKELGIARSTLHDHKVKLLRRFKEKFKDFYE